ncbi:hypothetical protein ES703_52589 [subsurface metagenome]
MKPLQLKKPAFAIPLALLAVVILSVIGVGLLSLGMHGRLFSVRTTSEVAARCAADAGLTKAVFEMNEKLKVTPWDGSTLPQATDEMLPNSDAILSYTVTGDIINGYTVECTGKSGRAERKINATLQLQGPFESAIFVDATIDLKSGTVVDWFNFGENERNLQVGTNRTEPASIDLKNGATVNGDVVVGAGGDPDVVINSTWATITGETYALTERYQLPPITVPQHIQELPSQGTIEESTTITTSGKYDEIDLANSKIITIDGPVILYIIGDIILKNSAELQVVDADTNPDASLVLYLGGDAEVKNSGAINNMAEDAKKVQIYGLDTCESIILKNNSNLYGTIYAPNADVEMKNSADIFGAVVARSFEQKNSATFNYDASLRDVGVDDEPVRFVVEQWREE